MTSMDDSRTLVIVIAIVVLAVGGIYGLMLATGDSQDGQNGVETSADIDLGAPSDVLEPAEPLETVTDPVVDEDAPDAESPSALTEGVLEPIWGELGGLLSDPGRSRHVSYSEFALQSWTRSGAGGVSEAGVFVFQRVRFEEMVDGAWATRDLVFRVEGDTVASRMTWDEFQSWTGGEGVLVDLGKARETLRQMQ